MKPLNQEHVNFLKSIVHVVSPDSVIFHGSREEHDAAVKLNEGNDDIVDIFLAEEKDGLALYVSATLNNMWLFDGDTFVERVDSFAWDEGGIEYKTTLVVNAYSNGFVKYFWN